MKRIFAMIAAVSTLMIVIAAGCIYWYSSADARSTELAAVETVANSMASSVALQSTMLQSAVDTLAASPDAVSALTSGNPELINATAAKLQQTIPNCLRLRLLLPNISEPDVSAPPIMGFGDMEMVKATISGNPQPVIQGEGEHRHLALTSAVKNGQQLVGIILVSLKPDLPKQTLANLDFDDGYIELKQDQLTLAAIGKDSAKDGDPETLKIPNSRWEILFWPDIGTGGGDIALLLSILLIPCLGSGLVFFIGFRKLSALLREDQSSIIKAAKDMMQGKTSGNYPVNLDEMMPVISSIAQFKRVIGHVNNQDVAPVDDIVGQEPDFFDESFNIDYLENTQSVAMPMRDSGFNPGGTEAVAMPSIEILSTEDELPEAMEMAFEAPASQVEEFKPAKPVLGSPDDFVSVKPLPESFLDMPVPDSWDLEITTKTILTPVAKPEFGGKPANNPAPEPVPQASTKDSERSIFCPYDIRGVVDKNLTPEIVGKIGSAFASEAQQHGVKTIVVAHDGRQTSAELCESLIQGITRTGCNVLSIGIAPTPLMYFVAHHSEGRSGVMVTGSSGPSNHNGLKFVLNDRIPGEKEIKALQRRVSANDFLQGNGSVSQNDSFLNEYIGMIADETNLVRPMTVALDCSNGSASDLAPMLLKAIGCDVVEINCELDGQFPGHAPDPGKAENFDTLIKAVKLNNADLGILLDGDADKLGMVDSGGNIIWTDRQMMLFARDVLANTPGSQVLYDSACSKRLAEQIAKRGGRPIMVSSRHDLISAELKSYNASLAGTMSGHLFFNDQWFGSNDALYAAVRMIQLLSADMRASKELFDDLPDSIVTPLWRVPLSSIDPHSFVEQCQAAIDFDAYIDTSDGLRIEFADGWGLIRASVTEPCLAVRFEADSREGMKRIQAQLKQLLLQIKSDLSLPF